MKSLKEVKGKVVYKTFEGGFWGIEADKNYFVINFPEQLKYKGVIVTCVIEEDSDAFSFISWGSPCTLVSFSTIYIDPKI